ncbi:RusA family crossover junction endodeoxyribonuclease [Corynebacterium sp.]|uniref:RusA family crossover junction endodeoxyribonuclease n=1 Tax=Corynebacterium sp. TaxID=1720 RepID=UPI003B3A9432
MTAFFVPGTPAPQGSKKYVGHRAGRPVLLESSAKVRPWRAVVAQVAALNCRGIIDGPVHVTTEFVMPRPKSLPKRVLHMVKKPDLDKLIRSTLDALSGIAYVDDNRVTTIHASKRYATTGEPTGAHITVTEGDRL